MTKIQFKISEVEYTGNFVSSKGLIEAIINVLGPTNVTSLQRLLGIVKYLAQCIRTNESAIT